MNNIENTKSNFLEIIDAFNFMKDNYEINYQLNLIQNLCINLFNKNGKILIAGNGGSAADAQHFAGELVSRFNFNRPALSAIALTTDSSVLTAIGNDYNFEHIFTRQILAHGKKNDIFFAISTSGNSLNIINAINTARNQGLVIIGLTGMSGGLMKNLCDVCICAPSNHTPRVQECHLFLEHLICEGIENGLFKYMDN